MSNYPKNAVMGYIFWSDWCSSVAWYGTTYYEPCNSRSANIKCNDSFSKCDNRCFWMGD